MAGCELLTLTVKGHMMVSMSDPTIERYGEIPEWTLGWKLKRALNYAELSAQDMAAELGVHVATVSRWMNDRESPRRAYLMAWALRCGVPFGWLTGDEELPRVDSNHQPAGWLTDSTPNVPPSTAELAQMGKTVPELRHLIRRGAPGDTAVTRSSDHLGQAVSG